MADYLNPRYFTPMNRLLYLLPFILFACGSPDAEVDISQQAESDYQPPNTVFPLNHWPVTTPAAVGIDSAILTNTLRYLSTHCKTDGLEETMIIRHGRVIWSGDSTTRVHDIWSCTKSFTSTAAGLLIADGKIELDQPVADHEPRLRTLYPKATYRHFLTMTSGYDAEGKSRWGEPSEDWSLTPFTPTPPLFEPGTAYTYWDEAAIMLGRALTLAAGTSLESYLAETLMSPIGIKDWSWWYEKALPDGTAINFGGTGLKMCAEDQARFGLLFLNDGVWNGKRILPADWVAEATVNQVARSLDLGNTDRKATDGRGIYGYNWWVINAADGVSPVNAYYTSGLNHNVCLVVPAWDMVIVRMGVDGNPAAGKHKVYSELLSRLEPGVKR